MDGIVEKIDKMRMERGWTVNKLASEAMLTQSTVANMFNTGAEPRISTLRAICEAFGGTVGYAKELMHGKVSAVERTQESALFSGLPDTFPVARYHSLAADGRTLPKHLRVTAETADGEVMAVEDAGRRVFGVQFHPESIMTPDGAAIVANFLSLVPNANANTSSQTNAGAPC